MTEDRRPRPSERGGGPTARGQRRGASRTSRDRRGAPDRRDARRSGGSGQEGHDAPEIPEDVTGRELDRAVRQQLRSLPHHLALQVARHLVAAGRLLQTDPEAAYQHTRAARARAGRLAIVREACGEAAYGAGHYAEALTELRAARRMSGSPDYLPMIADCERAVGKPERALALALDPAAKELDHAGRVELRIVAAGARIDMGQPEMAVRMLESAGLRSRAVAPWVARLRYAYAEALLAGGDRSAAAEWFRRAAAVDTEQVTDAAERLIDLEGIEVTDVLADEEDGPDEPGDDAAENGPVEGSASGRRA